MNRILEIIRFDDETNDEILIDSREFSLDAMRTAYYIIREYFHKKVCAHLEIRIDDLDLEKEFIQNENKSEDNIIK